MIVFKITIDSTQDGRLSLHYQAEGRQGSPAEGQLADALVESIKSLEQAMSVLPEPQRPPPIELGEGPS